MLRDEVARNHPAYTASAPLDDHRPNATSWTEIKKKIDAGKK